MTDAELIDAARRGSEHAFASLARRHHTALHRFLLIRCHSERDLDDVLQETWIAVYRYLDTYDRTWAFTTWLYRIALREAGRVRRQIPRLFEPSTDTPTPLTLCMKDESRANLWQIVQKELSRDQATLLWLFYAEDKSLDDAARILRRSTSWVKVNLHRARNRLKVRLEEPSAWLTLKDT